MDDMKTENGVVVNGPAVTKKLCVEPEFVIGTENGDDKVQVQKPSKTKKTIFDLPDELLLKLFKLLSTGDIMHMRE